MVTRNGWALVLLALCTLTLIACSDPSEQQPAEEVVEGAPTVSGSDTAAIEDAPMLTVAEANVDSIRLNVKQGDYFRYRIEQTNNSFQDSMNVLTTGGYEYDLKVKSVRSDGSVEFGMTFDQVKMNVVVKRVPGGQTVMENRFNSKDSADRANPQNQQFTALIGEEATILLSRTGELLEVSGLSPIINKIVEAAPPQQRQNPQLREQIKVQLESAMYASFIGQQMVPYPDGPLDDQGTWSKKQSSPVFGGLFVVNSTTDYAVQEIREVNDHRIAKIEATYAGTLKLGPPPPDATTKLTLNKSKISGSSNARLDLSTGMTVSKENRILMDVMATASDPNSGESRSMAQKQETTFKITLLR